MQTQPIRSEQSDLFSVPSVPYPGPTADQVSLEPSDPPAFTASACRLGQCGARLAAAGAGVVEYLEITNFRNIQARAYIQIRPLTLIVGKTASGKSSVRDAFVFVDTLLHGTQAALLQQAERWAYRDSESKAHELRIEIGMHPVNLGESLPHVEHLNDKLPLQLVWEQDDSNPLWAEYGEKTRISIAVSANTSGITKVTVASDVRDFFSIERISTSGPFELTVNQYGFGHSLQMLAAHDYELPAEEPANFKCQVLMCHQPLSLDLAGRSECYEFDRILVNLANFMLGRVAQLIQSPVTVSDDRGAAPGFGVGLLASASATLNLPAPHSKASSSWALTSTMTPTNHPTSDSFTTPAGDTSITIQSALEKLAISWLRRKSVDGAELQAKLSGHELPPTATDIRPRRHPFFATVVGEREEWVLGREPDADLTQDLHLYVNCKLSANLFKNQGFHIEHQLLAPPARVSLSAPNAMQDKTAVEHGIHFKVSGLIQSALSDSKSRQFEFVEVGAGVGACIPILTGLHAGFSYLQQPTLHLDSEKQLALANIILERVNTSPCTVIVECSEPRFVEYVLNTLVTRPTEIGRLASPLIHSDQVSVAGFLTSQRGTAVVEAKTFREGFEFLDEWIREFLPCIE